MNVWGPVIDLIGVEVGFVDGAGLGSGGDAVTLWVGDPTTTGVLADVVAYPAATSGVSYDVDRAAESVAGQNGAVETLALAGTSGTEPAVGSPGGEPATIFVDSNNTVVGTAFEAGQSYGGTLFSNTDAEFSTGDSPDDVVLGTSGDDNIWDGLEGNDSISLGTGTGSVTTSGGNNIIYMVDPNGLNDGAKDILTRWW